MMKLKSSLQLNKAPRHSAAIRRALRLIRTLNADSLAGAPGILSEAQETKLLLREADQAVLRFITDTADKITSCKTTNACSALKTSEKLSRKLLDYCSIRAMILSQAESKGR